MAIRQFIELDHTRLSYIDFGGNGRPLLALHGHYGCATMFEGFANAFKNDYRIIALDQRGHGWSDSTGVYTREAYINDILGLLVKLNLSPVIILGHSLGGVNAYQFAARYPELVRALIIEDIGMEFTNTSTFVRDWPKRFPSMKSIVNFLAERGMVGDTYFLESAVEYPDGWGFRFDYDQIAESQRLLKGNWKKDWMASHCPMLLLHGHASWALSTKVARESAACRPDTQLVEFPNCGHTIHDQDPEEFNKAVGKFLHSIQDL